MVHQISRVILVVLDGVGAGELPDADRYGDCGSNTLGNTARVVGGISLPNMGRLGLGRITEILGVPPTTAPTGCTGKMNEASPGKDTITGHWEIAGVVLDQPFPTFPHGFPAEVMSAFEKIAGKAAIGNCAASGTVIIEQLGKEHVLTGRPIVYTSADSVFQIAMHESVYGIERQYEICERMREILRGPNKVGRVICRPFTGTGNNNEVEEVLGRTSNPPSAGPFRRTERRKDYPVAAPATVLDELVSAGHKVHSIGKIYEIFNGRGISSYDHTTNNLDHIEALLKATATSTASLIFANLEDFDMLYGHRNDAPGMAQALEKWDAALPALMKAMRPDDMLIITADHGNDPTTPSTDHSREYPFLLVYGPNLNKGVDLGARGSYSDIAATLREIFNLPNGSNGVGFLESILPKR